MYNPGPRPQPVPDFGIMHAVSAVSIGCSSGSMSQKDRAAAETQDDAVDCLLPTGPCAWLAPTWTRNSNSTCVMETAYLIATMEHEGLSKKHVSYLSTSMVFGVLCSLYWLGHSVQSVFYVSDVLSACGVESR